MSTLLSQLRIAVIGGGISGVSTAASLIKLGAKRVTVYDKFASNSALHSQHAPATVVSPNGVLVLDALDLSSSLLPASQPIHRLTQRSARGDLLSSFSPSSVIRARTSTGAPLTSIATSYSTLHIALSALLPAHCLRWGGEVTAVERGEKGYKLAISGGGRRGSEDETTADVIVGADGLDSTTRNNHVLSRSVSPVPLHGLLLHGVAAGATGSEQGDDELLELWGNGQRFGCVRVGGGKVYWYATVAESYRSSAASPSQVASTFSSFPPYVSALIAATPSSSYRQAPLVHLPPVSPLYRDGVVLVGSSSCYLPPDFHQQTAQCLESALTLALSLRASSTVASALERFSRLRQGRLASVHTAAVSECESAVRQGKLMSSLRDMASSLMPKQVSNAVYEQAVMYNVLKDFPELNDSVGGAAAGVGLAAGAAAAQQQRGGVDEDDDADDDDFDELRKEAEEALEEEEREKKNDKRHH